MEKRWADYEPHPTYALVGVGCHSADLSAARPWSHMRHEHLGLSIPDFPRLWQIAADTSAAAVEQINSHRLATGEMKTTAAQIWIQMAHRMSGYSDRCYRAGILVEGDTERASCGSGH